MRGLSLASCFSRNRWRASPCPSSCNIGPIQQTLFSVQLCFCGTMGWMPCARSRRWRGQEARLDGKWKAVRGVSALQVSVSHETLLFEASEVSLDLGDVLWP